MLLKKSGVQHMLRAVATITKSRDIVMIGSGTLIAAANNLPAELMMTNEIDVYVRDAVDFDDMRDLIEGTLGEGTQFQKTFEYHVDAVSPRTAVLPTDWETRAVQVVVEGHPEVNVKCPSTDDVAISKCVAWREKDKVWLRACARFGLIDVDRMRRCASGLVAEDLAGLTVADIVERMDHVDLLGLSPNA